MLQNLGLPVKMPQSTGVDQLIDHIKFRRSMGEKYLIPRVDIVGKISPGGGNYRQIAEMAKIIDTLKIIHQ
jgi:hypothetical protein